MDYKNKATAYAIICLLFAVLIGYALKPIYLDWYFNMLEPISIEEAISKRDSLSPGSMRYGEVFLVKGIAANVWDDGEFMITDKYNQDYKMATGRNLLVHKTEKLNCKPVTGQPVTVAGSFNPGRLLKPPSDFYGVWVVGGCRP